MTMTFEKNRLEKRAFPSFGCFNINLTSDFWANSQTATSEISTAFLVYLLIY